MMIPALQLHLNLEQLYRTQNESIEAACEDGRDHEVAIRQPVMLPGHLLHQHLHLAEYRELKCLAEGGSD